MPTEFLKEIYSESIRISADGFCFVMPDGTGHIGITGPCTAVPCQSTEQLSQDDAETLFQFVFPEHNDLSVCIDYLPGTELAFVYGISPETIKVCSEQYGSYDICHYLTDIVKYRTGLICNGILVVRRGSETDIVAHNGSRVCYLNTLHIGESYQLLYSILKIWKECGLRQDNARISLCGISAEGSLIRNLKQMIGNNRVCVL